MYSISDEKIYDLVSQIYETAKDISSEAWLDVYQKMATLLSAGAGGLSLYSHNEERFDLAATTLDQDLVKQYNDFYQHVSPFHKKITSRQMLPTITRAIRTRRRLRQVLRSTHSRRHLSSTRQALFQPMLHRYLSQLISAKPLVVSMPGI